MIRIFRLSLIIIVLGLLVLGLNTSNQGINQLTMQDRGPVIGLNLGEETVTVQFLGDDYNYAKDNLNLSMVNIWEKGRIIAEKIQQYLYKIWIIFKAIFL